MKRKLAVGFAVWSLMVVLGNASAQTASEKVLVFPRASEAIGSDVWKRVPEVDSCYHGDPCDDHDDCTDDFCDFKGLVAWKEHPQGVCRHEKNDHCGGPPLEYKVHPIDVPALPTPPVMENPPAAEPEPLPVPETPVIPEIQPEPQAEPAPSSSFDLQFICGAAAEDTVTVDGRDVIFPIDAKGKRTHVNLKAVPSANGTSSALATVLSGSEKIELKQTGGSELVMVKSSDGEEAEGGALVVDASGEPGLVPTDFSFDAPIPVAPDTGGVEVYRFTATLIDAGGRTLATAVADCRVGLQVMGGGCSLVDGEFETRQVLGLFGIFLFALGALSLADKFKRSKN